MIARVPWRSGAYLSSISTWTSAWPFWVILMSLTVPAGTPPTYTSLPGTSWAAFWKRAVSW